MKLLARPKPFAHLALFALSLTPAHAASVPEAVYSDLHWRLVGPFRGGWATAVAGIPGDPSTFYFGGADGGVWKTTDAGSTWHPLFDRQGSASIGALAVAPSDPRVIWVGTGQIHQRWDMSTATASTVRPTAARPSQTGDPDKRFQTRDPMHFLGQRSHAFS